MNFLKKYVLRQPVLIIFVSFLTLIILEASVTKAAPGDLDTSFGAGGKVTKRFGGGEDSFIDVAVLPDGKILVLAKDQNFNIILARYNANGTPDTTFDGDGFIFINPGAAAFGSRMLLQPDGKILVVGSIRITNSLDDLMILRFNFNGTFDTSFNGNGKVFVNLSPGTDTFADAKLQADGKIVLVGTKGDITGYSDILLTKINPDGSFDTTFGANGIVTADIAGNVDIGYSIDLKPDGKILIVGATDFNSSSPSRTDLVLAQYLANGAPDVSFGNGGVKVHSLGPETYLWTSKILFQPDGKFLACVNIQFAGASALFRFLSNGEIDTTFGNNGRFTIANRDSYINDVFLEPDNKILVTGRAIFDSATFLDIYVARIKPDGTYDPTFGNGGITWTATGPGRSSDYAYHFTRQPDGKIIVVGDFSLSLFDYDGLMLRFQAEKSNIPYDFDGDGKTDISIFRPSSGEWWINQSSTNVTGALQFGSATDKLAPGDYTGDGKADIAFFRPSTGQWFIIRSEDFSFYAFPFGSTGDVPAPADYDADGKTDVAVFRASNSTWYIQKSSGGIDILAFGANGDAPVVSDYDGDGKADIAITRTNASNREWWIRRSSDGQVSAVTFGESTDKAVQGDYTGDGKADIAFWRPSNGFWYILRSEDNSFYSFPFGSTNDIPTPGDYDGDGKFDAAVFRPSSAVWYLSRSTAGFAAQQFGTSGDQPVPNAFVP